MQHAPGGGDFERCPLNPSPIAAQRAPAGTLPPLSAGAPSGVGLTPAPTLGGIDASKLKQVNGRVKTVSVSANTIDVEHDAVESLKLQEGSTVFHTDLPTLRAFNAGDAIIVNIDDSKGENVIVSLLNPKAAPNGNGFPGQGQNGQVQGQQAIPPQGQAGQPQRQQGAPSSTPR